MASFEELRPLFLLDPDVVYLNHGSFGACPGPVFAAYQQFQRETEAEPVEFLGFEAPGRLSAARQSLAGYVGCARDELVYFPNPTTAINMVARSLGLQPGDEILATDHEYGAMDRTWRFICHQTGARYVRSHVPLPLPDEDEIVERVWSGFSARTRVLFVSHITSQTAVRLPVEALCRRARQAGVLSIVDGAHAPGQIPLDLASLGADLYTGACHKWLCAPKGSAFLYASRQVQPQLDPLVVSWGWESDEPGPSPFIDHHEWQGTRDISAFLSVPAAIAFQAQYQWEEVRRSCHNLALEARRELNQLLEAPPLCPQEAFVQMFAVLLPDVDVRQLHDRLFDEYRVEVPAHRWNDRPLMRVSIQGYNSPSDIDALLSSLRQLL